MPIFYGFELELFSAADSLCTVGDVVTGLDGFTQWEVTVQADGSPFTCPIHTGVRLARPDEVLFWTAWSDPVGEMGAEAESGGAANAQLSKGSQEDLLYWRDPLEAAALAERTFYYGAQYYTPECPRMGNVAFSRNLFCLPLFTLLDKHSDQALSVIVDPRNTILDMNLHTSPSGEIYFEQLYHRMGGGRSITTTLYLVPHKKDIRGGMNFMFRQFPSYFVPKCKEAYKVAGGGAYTKNAGNFDAEKMARLGFKVNWKASFDFPYMGMFLPDVPDEEPWVDIKNEQTSILTLKKYSEMMRSKGFYVLNYFNMTEFGDHVEYPLTDEGSSGYIKHHFSKAVMLGDPAAPEFHNQWYCMKPNYPFYSWEGCIVMDPGEKNYQDFLVEQAKRHVEKLPASSGICIDRIDWLRFYNVNADDGISYVNKPVRSLYVSWQEAIRRVSDVFHDANKVVYINNHVKRVDLLDNIDGFFDEFTYAATSLNTTAMLGLNKPVIGWISDASQLVPTPDAFFQRFLYMGVFPVVPFPDNDHSIQPTPEIEGYYMDYAPLFALLPGKKWCLEEGALQVSGAKANLFEIPQGYVVPIIYAESQEVQLTLALNPKEYQAFLCYPGGEKTPISLPAGENISLTVPTKRDCCIVLLEQK